jgi:hypothetical protein
MVKRKKVVWESNEIKLIEKGWENNKNTNRWHEAAIKVKIIIKST